MRVKMILQDKGMSLRQLAAIMEAKPETLSRAISDKGNPTKSTLEKIATALDVPISDLFTKPSIGTITCPNCGVDVKLTAEKM
jgi:transcriptional regulator with XRE-family HTH domain